MNLVNIDAKFEEHVNTIIAKARQDIKSGAGDNFAWTAELKEKFLGKLYEGLGDYRPGTGIIAGFAGIGREVSLHPQIVYWMAHDLDPKQDEIVYIKFRQTRYGKNKIGIIDGKVVSHKTMRAADHSIAPVVKVQDVLMGTDKWGHFFMQGYWYWVAKLPSERARTEYGQYMEGDPALYEERRKKYRRLAIKWIPNFRFGYFGGWSTGVVSRADGQANEAGFHFYQSMFADPDNFQFRTSDYVDWIPNMNEQTYPSKFTYDIDVNDDVAKGTHKLTTQKKDVTTMILAHRYDAAVAEADRLMAKLLLVEDYYAPGEVEAFKALRKAALFYRARCQDPSDEAIDLRPSATFRTEFGLPEEPQC